MNLCSVVSLPFNPVQLQGNSGLSHAPEQRNQAEPIMGQVELRPGVSRFLQRHAGNYKMQEMGLYSGQTLQRSVADNTINSLVVNRPDDEYEQEADEVAEQVISLPDATPEIRSLRRTTRTDLQRTEAGRSPQVLPSIRQVNRPLRPSNPVDQMSKLLGTAQGNASRQAKLCYRAFARNVLLAGGYGDILNLKDDERFQGYMHHALLFADAVAKNGAEQLGLEEIIGNPFHAEPGTILVLFGSAELGIDMNWGDISVIGGWSGRNRVCYNDGTMVLPGVAASWDPGGQYAGLVAGMYRPLLRPALEEKPRSGSIELQRLQRRAATTPASDIAPLIVHDVLHAPSQPLETGTRAFMEPRFGQDFSGVRIHTDAHAVESALSVNALAYTVGNNVVFGAGKYAPGTLEGKRLIAHELTHVVQQGQGSASRSADGEDSVSASRPDQIARAPIWSDKVRVTGVSALTLARQPRSLSHTLDQALLSNTELQQEIQFLREQLTRVLAGSERDQLRAQLEALEACAWERGMYGIPMSFPSRSLSHTLDPALLSHTELQQEIQSIREHLARLPAGPEQDQLRAQLQILEDFVWALGIPKADPSKSGPPRSLDQTLDPVLLSDAEAEQEIRLIHFWLARFPSPVESERLQSALKILEMHIPPYNNYAEVQKRINDNRQSYSADVTMYPCKITSRDTLSQLAKDTGKDNRFLKSDELARELETLNKGIVFKAGNGVILLKGWASPRWKAIEKQYPIYEHWEREQVQKGDANYYHLVDRVHRRMPELYVGRKDVYVKFVVKINEPWIGQLNEGEYVALPVGWKDPNIASLPEKFALTNDVAQAIAIIYAEQQGTSLNALAQQKYIWYSIRRRVVLPNFPIHKLPKDVNKQESPLKTVLNDRAQYQSIGNSSYDNAINDLKKDQPTIPGVINALRIVQDHWDDELPKESGAYYFHWNETAIPFLKDRFEKSKAADITTKEKECVWEHARTQGFVGNISKVAGWHHLIRGDEKAPDERKGSMYIFP